MSEKKNKSKREIILEVILLTWFISSMIAFVFAGSINETIGVFIFGQIFYTVGLLALYERTGMVILHYLAGMACMIGSAIAYNYDKISVIMSDLSSKQALLIIFVSLIGIASLVALIIHLLYKKSDRFYWPFMTLSIAFVTLVIYLSFY